MASISEALSQSEAGAISVVSAGLGIDRTEFQAAMLKMKSIFETNRPMRERVRSSLAEGIPWTRKEKLATVLTGLGAYASIKVIAFACAGKLAAFGVTVATAIGLTASAGPLVIAALVLLCAFVIFYAIGEIGGIVSGVADYLRGALA